MSEMTRELFIELDEDIRKLLTLVHEIKIDSMTQNRDKKKIENALLLSEKITAGLFTLLVSEK